MLGLHICIITTVLVVYKENMIYKDGFSLSSGLQREYDPLGTIVFKFLCISSAQEPLCE